MDFKITNQTKFNNRKLLDPAIKNTWVDALKSGNYKKGTLYLKHKDTFCCLGVFCEINDLKCGAYQYLDDTISGMYNLEQDGSFEGFTIDNMTSLTSMNDRLQNDTQLYNFTQIAQVIELYF